MALQRHDGGYFHRRFQRELMGRRWRLDFFFWEARLGVEIDGAYHAAPAQRALDRRKRVACQQFDVELMRFTNEEMIGGVEAVVTAIRKANDARLSGPQIMSAGAREGAKRRN
jgi:very-short-patch-repair endonuclease